MRSRVPDGWEGGHEGLLFFAQRMEELLFDYTLDTYKPAALNAVSLCSEALSLIDDIGADVIDAQALESVIDELRWSIARDPIAKSLLDADADKYIRWHPDGDLQHTKLGLEAMGRLLNTIRYVDRCHELLIAAIYEKKKIDIDFCAQQLCTTLINAKLSKSYIYREINSFFENGLGKGEVGALLKLLKSDIYPMSHDFHIYVLVSSDVQVVSESVSAFGIKILRDFPEELAAYALTNGFIRSESQVIVEISKVRAADVDSARVEAERRIGQLSELFMLFSHRVQIHWGERAIINQCCLDGPKLVGRHRNAMEKGYNLTRSKAAKRLNWLIENISLSRDDGSFDRFNRVVELHGVSLSTHVQENQLLSLWICLESLLPARGVKGMIEVMMPTLMTNYLSRIIGRLSGDLLRWNKAKLRGIIRRVPGIEGSSLNQKLFNLLSLAECAPLREEIFADLGEYHLLRFRIFTLSHTLSDKERLSKFFNRHEKKLRWHIRRIYRTRNLIVHAGVRPRYLDALIENCHDYLDQIVVDIIKLSCEDTGATSISQIFEILRIRFETYKDELKRLDLSDIKTTAFLSAKTMGLRL